MKRFPASFVAVAFCFSRFFSISLTGALVGKGHFKFEYLTTVWLQQVEIKLQNSMAGQFF